MDDHVAVWRLKIYYRVVDVWWLSGVMPEALLHEGARLHECLHVHWVTQWLSRFTSMCMCVTCWTYVHEQLICTAGGLEPAIYRCWYLKFLFFFCFFDDYLFLACSFCCCMSSVIVSSHYPGVVKTSLLLNEHTSICSLLNVWSTMLMRVHCTCTCMCTCVCCMCP